MAVVALAWHQWGARDAYHRALSVYDPHYLPPPRASIKWTRNPTPYMCGASIGGRGWQSRTI